MTFTTYPTLTALYAAYEAKVTSLNSGQFQQNVQNCGLIAPSPYGEIGWNHDEQHPGNYTVAEMAAGKVPFASAAGRMACIATAQKRTCGAGGSPSTTGFSSPARRPWRRYPRRVGRDLVTAVSRGD